MNVTFMSIFDDERHNHHFPPRGEGRVAVDDLRGGAIRALAQG
jgi:hypothetical protein